MNRKALPILGAVSILAFASAALAQPPPSDPAPTGAAPVPQASPADPAVAVPPTGAVVSPPATLTPAPTAAPPTAPALTAPPPALPPPTTTQPPPPAEEQEPVVKDGVRVRGGFSVNGGVLLIPDLPNSLGGTFGLAARLGIQINHFIGITYQNTPMVTLIKSTDSIAAGFIDYNSLLATLTLAHTFDFAAGPSLDFAAVGACDTAVTVAGVNCGGGTGLYFGGHARIAANIGGLSGSGPRRSGFAIGVDAHPMMFADTLLLTLTAGLGAEWY